MTPKPPPDDYDPPLRFYLVDEDGTERDITSARVVDSPEFRESVQSLRATIQAAKGADTPN